MVSVQAENDIKQCHEGEVDCIATHVPIAINAKQLLSKRMGGMSPPTREIDAIRADLKDLTPIPEPKSLLSLHRQWVSSKIHALVEEEDKLW